ncbi:two-component sensor histidine kinase [Planobispora longispora]|uniref:histidine kinase n=1 Tax=Planobispora longispora TaxID=28887 RepID=A0A8J3RJ62_9ACTN|nr:histidine kinase [Planobispora longispora]GIH75141.1 two-component sensor histidine kinase [Planobispora longispora]
MGDMGWTARVGPLESFETMVDRMRRKDLLWATASFAVGLILIAANAYISRATPAYLLIGPLLITCLGVAVRRSRPILCLVFGVVAMIGDFALGPSLGTILIITDNSYAAVRYGPRPLGRWMLAVTSVVAVVGGAVAGFVSRDLATFAVALVQAGLVGVTPVLTALFMRQLEDQAVAERVRAEQVARLAELDRKTAVQAERTRMARELHDMIANHFSAIAIQSTAVLSRKDLDGAAVRRVLESVRENSLQGMTEMRSMIGLLRQDGEEAEAVRLRLAEAEVLAERAREAGLEVRFRVDGEARDLPAPVDLAGYRILQEALTNALKHGGKEADMVVGYRPDEVVLTVGNPVDGVRPGLPGAGVGIIGMRERATLVGGIVESGPHDEGWRVRAVLPTSVLPTSALPTGTPPADTPAPLTSPADAPPAGTPTPLTSPADTSPDDPPAATAPPADIPPATALRAGEAS